MHIYLDLCMTELPTKMYVHINCVIPTSEYVHSFAGCNVSHCGQVTILRRLLPLSHWPGLSLSFVLCDLTLIESSTMWHYYKIIMQAFITHEAWPSFCELMLFWIPMRVWTVIQLVLCEPSALKCWELVLVISSNYFWNVARIVWCFAFWIRCDWNS